MTNRIMSGGKTPALAALLARSARRALRRGEGTESDDPTGQEALPLVAPGYLDIFLFRNTTGPMRFVEPPGILPDRRVA